MKIEKLVKLSKTIGKIGIALGTINLCFVTLIFAIALIENKFHTIADLLLCMFMHMQHCKYHNRKKFYIEVKNIRKRIARHTIWRRRKNSFYREKRGGKIMPDYSVTDNQPIIKGSIFYVVRNDEKELHPQGRPMIVVSSILVNDTDICVNMISMVETEFADLPTHVNVKFSGKDCIAVCERIHRIPKNA